MKSVIQSNAVKEAKAMWAAYGEYVKDNTHIFKEKKKESKIGHGIEPARAPQSKDQEDSMEGLSKSEKIKKKFHKFWKDNQPAILNARETILKNKTDLLLTVIIFLILVIFLKISSI